MKYPIKNISLVILTSLTLFVTGFYSYHSFLDLILPKIDGIKYQPISVAAQFSTSILFGAALALIPLLAILVWKFTPINATKNRIISMVIIACCIIAAIFARQYLIELYAKRLIIPMSANPGTAQVVIPLSKLYFEQYIIEGLIIGCIISYFSFKQRK